MTCHSVLIPKQRKFSRAQGDNLLSIEQCTEARHWSVDEVISGKCDVWLSSVRLTDLLHTVDALGLTDRGVSRLLISALEILSLTYLFFAVPRLRPPAGISRLTPFLHGACMLRECMGNLTLTLTLTHTITAVLSKWKCRTCVHTHLCN